MIDYFRGRPIFHAPDGGPPNASELTHLLHLVDRASDETIAKLDGYLLAALVNHKDGIYQLIEYFYEQERVTL